MTKFALGFNSIHCAVRNYERLEMNAECVARVFFSEFSFIHTRCDCVCVCARIHTCTNCDRHILVYRVFSNSIVRTHMSQLSCLCQFHNWPTCE